ncbi:MAG: hypothetical protein ACK4VN_09325 [Bacteroidales bacterium]
MEFTHNFLTPRRKSPMLIVMGAILVATTLYIQIFESFLDSIGLAVTNLAIGFNLLARGIGHPLEALAGRQYIAVNSQSIELKPKLLKKANRFLWSDIAQLELWPGLVVVSTQQGKTFKKQIRDLDPEVRHEFLMTLIHQAEDKQIPCLRHGYLTKMR